MAPSRPSISVILATANRADWVEAPVRSVLAQSFQDLELLVVDCSPDDLTESVIQPLAEEDERVRYLSAEGADRSGARALGLGKARAPLVSFMDVHALWEPAFLERLHEAMARGGESCPFAYCGARCLNESGEVTEEFPREFPEGALGAALFQAPRIPPAASLIRASVFQPLLSAGNRFWFGNDEALSFWLASEGDGQIVRQCLVSLREIEGMPPLGVHPLSEQRGEILVRAMQELRAMVPSRVGRRALADYYGRRGEMLSAYGRKTEGMASAARVLIYTPLSIGAWARFLRLALKL